MRAYFFILLVIIYSCLDCVNSQSDMSELMEHVDSVCEDPDHKHYDKVTMGYITPWNRNGLDLALRYSAKFDFLSPCWFEIKPENFQGKFNSKIEGSNNVDSAFMSELREKSPKIKILPRFKCEGFNAETYELWLKEENRSQFIKILMRRLKYNKLDGLVLECNHIWLLENLYADFALMITNLSEALKKEKLQLILTVFPYSESFASYLSKIRFEYLSKYVDYFSVMTYDYMQYQKNDKSTLGRPFNAPLSWINKTLDYYVDSNKANKEELHGKILLGLPFHGFVIEQNKDKPKMDFLEGNSFGSLLSSSEGSLDWDETECEHLIKLNSRNTNSIASFPTKKFFKERLSLSKSLGLGGVAVWDLAQGLESFLDEF